MLEMLMLSYIGQIYTVYIDFSDTGYDILTIAFILIEGWNSGHFVVQVWKIFFLCYVFWTNQNISL